MALMRHRGEGATEPGQSLLNREFCNAVLAIASPIRGSK